MSINRIIHLKEKILLFIAKTIFYRVNNCEKDRNKNSILWERKQRKYYEALFNQTHISIKECMKLIRDELRCEITVLPRIVIVISTRCSLKCKYCGEFIPYFQNKEDISADEVITELYIQAIGLYSYHRIYRWGTVFT